MSHAAYELDGWDNYALAHQSVMPSLMLKLNEDVAQHMSGEVADFGCGTAKVAPFVLDNPKVAKYIGIDAAPVMVARSKWMLQQFSQKPGDVICSMIDDFNPPGRFDSALSINSYYAWDEPVKTLKHIFQLLKSDGIFVLATPNPRIDMPRLLDVSRKELVAHPSFGVFSQMNRSFCENPSANFLEMDDLIRQCQNAGFHVREADQKHYLGGLNFLILSA